ncbi:MAG: AbrB family transcriptional regulator [Omnitrophica bacterium RIFCSPHIGHO2_02_FULL_51_18]|nr:MAG: AbrB family transcriptional regulator [Omnitrophica bacterium RIFCSPHIGHO2_02_FULL_51_18]
MASVLISTKYQVVIPKEVRGDLRLKPGHKMICIAKDGVIHLIPDRPISSLRGFAKGMSIEGLRDKTDRV